GTSAAQQPKRLIGVTQNRVDSSFRPPAEIQRNQPFGEADGVGFVQEKIVVVKLHGVNGEPIFQKLQDGSGALAFFGSLPSLVNGDDAAECAAKGTPDARLVYGCSSAKKRRENVALGV